MNRKLSQFLPGLLFSGMIAITLAFSVVSPSHAFTAADANNAWNNYNNAFYVSSNGLAYYRWLQGGGQDTINFWQNAEEIEMAVDRAQRSGSTGDKAIVTALVNQFDTTFGTDWTNDPYNDDIMWACLAHLRAYYVTGSTNVAWALYAANNFNCVYNGGSHRTQPQVDGTYGGGMWWTTDHSASGTKNACDNGPAAIAAFYLFTIFPSGTGYLAQSNALYNWEKGTLVTSGGAVFDHIGSTGLVGYDLSYNSGTLIGAAYLLGDLTEAKLLATGFQVISPGIFPSYGSGGSGNDGFNGIFMRWMAIYMYGSNTQSLFSTWLYENANAALAVENSQGLSWNNWTATTPYGGQYSWDCSDAVVALNVLNPQSP